MNLVGRIFGTRKILKNYCEDEDFIKAGMKIPKSDETKRRYVLGQCLNCGTIKPTDIGNLYKTPPKRCSFCSNISHHSSISSYTNIFTGYEEDGYAIIDITFQGEIYPVYIDFEDLEKCKEKSWRISKKRNKFYVISGEKENAIYLHQFVFGLPPTGYEIDHIDGNSLNNRKSNLRYLTRGDNARFTKVRIDSQIGIRGVSYNKKEKMYVVDFTYNKHRLYFKHWEKLEEAVWCRYCAEKHYGLETLIKNPLFKDYDTLTSKEKDEINSYVLSIIKNSEKSPV